MIRPRGAAMTWLCGLYRIEEGLPVFVILTREPGEGIRFIHNRMPLIMPESLVNEWIRPDARPEELAAQALTDMVYDRYSDPQMTKPPVRHQTGGDDRRNIL